MNLLGAGYEGKLAQSYGVRQKGRFYIKAVPFSHTPHNTNQTKAKDAFTGLNRIASRVVKSMWRYLGLSDKTMYRNNALCQAWKGALSNNSFSLENLKQVVSENDALKIETVFFETDGLKFSFSATEENPSATTEKQVIYLAVVTNKFVTKGDIAGVGNAVLLSSIFNYIDFAYFRVWAFKAVPNGKRWKLEGLAVTDAVFIVIINEIFYTGRWHWTAGLYVEEEVLFLPAEPSYIDNEVLYLN